MDIRDIREELVNLLAHSDEYFREHTTQLVLKMDEFIKEENNNINSGRVSSVLEYYKNLHEILVRQYKEIPSDAKNMFNRLYKAQEILVNIDLTNYYIKWALSKCTGINVDNKMLTMLRSDQDYFKGASYDWVQILNSINSEVKLKTAVIQSKQQQSES